MAGGARARVTAAVRRTAVVLAAALAGTLLVTAASAHRLKEALTTIALNERTGLVEIIHRFYVHDAEHAVSQLAGLSGDIRSDELLRIAFARYVARKFTLADQTLAPLEIDLVGVELEGPFLWVYQEMPGDAFEAIAWVSHKSMQDVWSDQVNQVNIKRDDGVRSLFIQYSDNEIAVPPRDRPAAAADATETLEPST